MHHTTITIDRTIGTTDWAHVGPLANIVTCNLQTDSHRQKYSLSPHY